VTAQLQFIAQTQGCYSAAAGQDVYVVIRPVSSGSVSLPGAYIALFLSGATETNLGPAVSLEAAVTLCQNDVATRSS